MVRSLSDDVMDVDLEKVLIEAGLVDELFYIQDFKQRKLFLNADIDQTSVIGIVRNIIYFNSIDKGTDVSNRKPILLYISSHGGDVDAGFELIDMIQSSKTPVYTVNLSCWYSMGFLIGIAGHKRFATQHSKVLMHDGSTFVYNSGAKAQDQMRFQAKSDKRIKHYVLSRSNITPEEYDDQFRSEWYMFSDEAKRRGFIDCIVGDDCDIDDIV